MNWRRLAFWNAAGGISWAMSVGRAAYLLGHAAASAFRTFGLVGAVLVVLAAVAILIWHRLRARGIADPHDN